MEKVAATSAYSEPSVTARMVIWNMSKKKGEGGRSRRMRRRGRKRGVGDLEHV